MATLANGHDVNDDLRDRAAEFRRLDSARDDFCLQLIDQLHSIKTQYELKCTDYDSEVASRRYWQHMATEAGRELQTTKSLADRDRFVLVLIDGDGAIFKDQWLMAGDSGGADAAYTLLKGIEQQLQQHFVDGAQYQVVVQIYVNMEGLSKKLASVGIISHPQELYAFARAFTLNQPLFSFIDVGFGKERADHKIRETFRLFVHNVQCKHIVLAVCHDNGYLNNIEPYKRDETVNSRLTLLQTTPAERGYEALGFPIISIDSVFRSTPLPLIKPPAPAPASVSASLSAPVFVPQALRSRENTDSSTPTSATPQSTTGTTWATVGGNASSTQINIASTKAAPVAKKVILLNGKEQRIDPKLPKADPMVVTRLHQIIAKQKVCNSYHITGKCEDGEYCQYGHGERLEAKLQNALRHKARSQPCGYASACRDFVCVFGHHCPRELCNKDDCRFWATHGVDTEPRLALFEDGKLQAI